MSLKEIIKLNTAILLILFNSLIWANVAFGFQSYLSSKPDVYEKFIPHQVRAKRGGDNGPKKPDSQATFKKNPQVRPPSLKKDPMLVAPVNLKAAATRVCEKFNFKESWCRNDLLAISYVESRWNIKAIGDKGLSFGPYQIHTGFHRWVNRSQAFNFEWSAKFTLQRMVACGYPKYRTKCLGRHNGSWPKSKPYAELVKWYSARIK